MDILKMKKSCLQFRAGDWGVLSGLKRSDLNMQTIRIVGYVQKTQRYAVKLDKSGTLLQVKPCKIHFATDERLSAFPYISTYLQYKSISLKLESNPSIKELRDMQSQIEQLTLTESQTMHLVDGWAQMMFSFPPGRVGMEMIPFLEKMVAKAQSERARVLFTIDLARAYNYSHSDDKQKILSLLEPLVKTHYGYLSSIATILVQTYNHDESQQESDKWLGMFYDTDLVIKNQMHNATCNTASFYRTFVNSFAIGFDPPSKMVLELAQYVILRFEEECVESPLFAHDAWSIKNEKAWVAYHRQNYKAALDFTEAYLQQFKKVFGSANQVGYTNVFKMRFHVYIKLQERKNAKENLKQVTRYALMDDDDQKMIVKMKEMLRGLGKPTNMASETRKLQTVERCGNPFCKNIETTEKQFQACGRCLMPVYCSKKCQKTHWKNGHRQTCRKA